MTGRLAGIARRARPKAAMEELAQGSLTCEAGIEGDARGRPGPRQALEPDWRGGVTCRVVTGAWLRVGDAVAVEKA